MTQEQRTPEAIHAMAADICRKIYGEDERAWPDGLCNSIDKAITAEIRAETEACAKVADEFAANARYPSAINRYQSVAAAIRTRAP